MSVSELVTVRTNPPADTKKTAFGRFSTVGGVRAFLHVRVGLKPRSMW